MHFFGNFLVKNFNVKTCFIPPLSTQSNHESIMENMPREKVCMPARYIRPKSQLKPQVELSCRHDLKFTYCIYVIVHWVDYSLLWLLIRRTFDKVVHANGDVDLKHFIGYRKQSSNASRLTLP